VVSIHTGMYIATYVYTYIADSTFLQPRWVVPSTKPKDLETGWKELYDNSVNLVSHIGKSVKRASDFSGLISTEIATGYECSLMNQSSFVNSTNVRRYICVYIHMLEIYIV